MVPNAALEASTIGILARRILNQGGVASVLASFERSFYLDIGGELVAIGSHDLQDGPLNVRLAPRGDDALSARLQITPGQPWTIASDRLRRDDDLTIDLANAATWAPKTPSSPPDRLRLHDGLSELRRLLMDRKLPAEGLIGLVIEDRPPQTPTERIAAPRIAALEAALPRWLKGEIEDLSPAIQLLGLGPGLTPSGDDLLAGILITWRHLGAIEAADRLAAPLLAAARQNTGPISQAHLRAASKGYGAAPLHDLLDATLRTGQQGLRQTLDAAAKIGHSSGLDAIAGVVLALKAWLRIGDDAARRDPGPPVSED